MGLPGDLVAPIATCLNPDFTFPAINLPGLPNFALSSLLATMGGISFILDFIPPTPDKIANLAPPGIPLFLAPFLGSVKLPASFPSISIGPVTIPGVGSAPYERPLDAELKLITMVVTLPFTIITTMVEKLLQLTIELPTLSGIYAIFVDLAISAGLSGEPIAKFGLCLAQAIFDLFTALIPV